MGIEPERSWRRYAALVLIISIVAVGGVSSAVLENLPPPDYELVAGTEDIFLDFGRSSNCTIVDVDEGMSQGMLLSLVSLQGLVNRHGAQIYLEMKGAGNMSFLTPFLDSQYNLNASHIDASHFLQMFSSYANGLVVYDESRPDTINVATTIAGLDDLVIVDPTSAQNISQLMGHNIVADLREAPWAGLDGVQLYRKSFDEHFSRSHGKMLAILPPDRLGVRDYIIAAKVWTFHVLQGPFSSQENIDFTEDVLASTPHNIPILGWFEAPTLVEENYFVQSASRHGKTILGGLSIPNISFLSGLSPQGQFTQGRVIPLPPGLADDGIYVSFTVPDGDNLDFISDKMHEMWMDDARGSVPVAWSISPVLTQLAPPLLDYYYSTASEIDTFVAGPSGAGYLYPGYAPDADLKQHLVRTGEMMAAADIDVVWLLNSFKAYEIPYSEEDLEAYVAALAPRGIMLDYADQAVTRDAWMQISGSTASPVVRSTHLWSGMENLIGKVMSVVDAAPSRPHFFAVTVYPWSLKLGDAVRSLQVLQDRYGGRVHAVSIENLFSLVTDSFVQEAREAVEGLDANPIAALGFWEIEQAKVSLNQAEIHLSNSEISLAGLKADEALGHARRATAIGAIVLAVILLVVIVVFLRARSQSRKVKKPRALDVRTIGPSVAAIALFYLFFAGLQHALDYNFWTYASVFVAGACLVLTPKLQTLLERTWGRNAWPLEALVLAASGLFLLWEPWAFVPFACSGAMLLSRFLWRESPRRELDVVVFGVGIAMAVLVPFGWPSLLVLVTIVAVMGHVLYPATPMFSNSGGKGKVPGVTFAATALAMCTIWVSLFQNRYFVERAGGNLDLLLALAVIALVFVPIGVLALWTYTKPQHRVGAIVVLAASTAVWVVLWFAQNTALFAILVLVTAAMISWSVLSASSRVRWTGLGTAKFVSGLLILGTIVFVLVRMPALVYSLYVVRGLPVAVEYILYTPPLLMIFVTLDIVQTEALFRAARRDAKGAAGSKNRTSP